MYVLGEVQKQIVEHNPQTLPYIHTHFQYKYKILLAGFRLNVKFTTNLQGILINQIKKRKDNPLTLKEGRVHINCQIQQWL
jgi:hypothetical protein